MIYRSGFRRYATFTGLTATQMIDEAIEDQRRDLREKTDVVKRRLIEFYHRLINEAPKKKGKVVKKGIASKTAHCFLLTSYTNLKNLVY